MKEFKIKANSEESSSILKAREDNFKETGDSKQAELAGDRRAMEIALRRREESGLGVKWTVAGYNRRTGEKEGEPESVEFVYTMPEEKPSDKWMVACKKKVASYAGDPETFCNGLWCNPKSVVGGEEMTREIDTMSTKSEEIPERKEAPEKEETPPGEVQASGKTAGKTDWSKLTPDDIKEWQTITEKYVAKHGVEEAIKVLSKEAAEKKIERPITFALSLVDSIHKAINTTVNEGTKKTKELDKDTESAIREEKKFIGSCIRKARAFAIYCKSHTKNAGKHLIADRILHIANQVVEKPVAEKLYKEATDLYREVTMEQKTEKPKTSTLSPEDSTIVKTFQATSNKLFASLRGNISLGDAVKVLGSMLEEMGQVGDKTINASEIRQLQIVANAISPACITASEGTDKVEATLLSDYEAFEASVKIALEEKMDIKEAIKVMEKALEVIKETVGKGKGPEHKEEHKEHKEEHKGPEGKEIPPIPNKDKAMPPIEKVMPGPGGPGIEASKKKDDDEDKKKKEKEEKEAKEKKEKEKKEKKGSDPLETIFESGVPKDFEKVKTLKGAYDPALEIPTEYEKITKEGEEAVMAQEERKVDKDERTVAREDGTKIKEEGEVTKAVLGSEAPSEEKVQLAIQKLSAKRFINDLTRTAAEQRCRKLTAGQLDNFITIVEKTNPDTALLTDNGQVVDLGTLFDSDVPTRQ